MNLRLFCALSAPSPLQDQLAAATHSLRGPLSPASISWVRAGNFHLTLSFLGDVEQFRVGELAPRLRAACEDVGPFELVCQGLGCFPNPNRPRVIWAGVRSVGDELSQLQDSVAVACAAFAPRKEKGRFNGHITLGRIRPSGSPPQGRLAQEIERHRDTLFGRWQVNEVELLCSDLSQGAPRYSALHRFSLTCEPR